MVQRIERLVWSDSPLVWPLAIYPIDFAVDAEFNWLELDSTFRDIPSFRPKFLCIDNTESNQALRVFFDNLNFPIVPFQRLTLPIPLKCRQVRLINAGTELLTCDAIFSVEDISAGDTINFGLATNSGSFGVTWPIEIRTGPYDPLATDNHKVEYWFIAGPTAAELQDQASLPNGWTIQLWNDQTSTANVTVTAADGSLINGASSFVLTPGNKIWLIWDGAEYRLASIGSGGVPSGTILDYGGGTIPSGFVLCDGAAISRTTFAALFLAIGTTWGVGDGSTTFNVPDFRGRVTAGRDNMGGAAAGRLTATTIAPDGNTIAGVGGAQQITLTIPTMPSHQHDYQNRNFALRTSTGVNTAVTAVTDQTSLTGGGGAHDNVQPTAIVNKMIKT